jgi:hypothetical protein
VIQQIYVSAQHFRSFELAFEDFGFAREKFTVFGKRAGS